MNDLSLNFLLCKPDFFSIDYCINPWMLNQKIDLKNAMEQWNRLSETIRHLGGEIKTVKQVKGCPDMVFTANSGIAFQNKFLPAAMKYTERQVETIHFKRWFEKNGYDIVELIPGFSFEGRGDVLIHGNTLVGGYGYRTDLQSLEIAAGVFNLDLIHLELINPRFYHLDTCFCKVGENKFIYFPNAFKKGEIKKLKKLNIELIPVSEEDARLFICNSMLVGDVLLVPELRCDTVRSLRDNHGIKVCHVNVSEFLKSGGSIQCLCLRI